MRPWPVAPAAAALGGGRARSKRRRRRCRFRTEKQRLFFSVVGAAKTDGEERKEGADVMSSVGVFGIGERE
jgi:hypothetical protein